MREGPIDAYQFTRTNWAKISPILTKLKKEGIVQNKRRLVRGGAGGQLSVISWFLKK